MRRGWLIAAVLIGLLAIVIAAVAMRLSDDGPPTAEEWADEVCSSLSDWRESITSLADVGDEPLTADSLRDRLDEAESATSDLVTELRELGPPDLESGDELEAELDDATAELEASFDDLKESAQAAADAPAGEFLGELATLASAFAALQSAIGETVNTLRDSNIAEDSRIELEQAFADAPSCQSPQAEG
jgi:hypothetical protein